MVRGCRKLRRYRSLSSPSLAKRHVRPRYESRNNKDTTHCIFLQQKSRRLHESPLRHILGRRRMVDVSSKWRGCERPSRKYLQVCTSYHGRGKDGSSEHGVLLAPCYTSSGSISDIDSFDPARLKMVEYRVRSPCRAAVRKQVFMGSQ